MAIKAPNFGKVKKAVEAANAAIKPAKGKSAAVEADEDEDEDEDEAPAAQPAKAKAKAAPSVEDRLAAIEAFLAEAFSETFGEG